MLESAARLQEVLPDAVLVGGSAAALYAGHRESGDHDHVLADLSDRFDAVLEAIEATEGWVTNRVVPGKVILGELGGIESGVRQMRRTVPIEVDRVELADGSVLQVPTMEEALRIKAYLLVRRNQTRDYLDVAALSDRLGVGPCRRRPVGPGPLLLPERRRLNRRPRGDVAVRGDPGGDRERNASRLAPPGTGDGSGSVRTGGTPGGRSAAHLPAVRDCRAAGVGDGKSRGSFAERIGTSTSRLSTYLSGSVTPSAALMVRMRRVAGARP